MSRYDDENLDNRIEHRKIRLELIDYLKESLMKNSDVAMVETKGIYKAIYEFIFKKIFKDIKEDHKKVDKFTWKVFKKTVDWTLTYGYIVRETLIFIREYHDLAMQEKTSEQVEA